MFVGSSNELGAFESGLTAKLMGTVTAVVLRKYDFAIVATTAIISPTFRKNWIYEKILKTTKPQD
jgi:hypothetical protein